MPEIALEPRPGDSLGPYRSYRLIGRGRMGIGFDGSARALTRSLEAEPEDRPLSATDYVAGVARASRL